MPTIVEYCSEHSGYRCGYCNSADTNFSHGMWAHTMTVKDYQDLIDRGWRRSGKYCYKPTMDITCCPMYTIRCRIQEFKATKSQKKILKRFNKFMIGNESESLTNSGRKMSTCSGNTDEEEALEGREYFMESSRVHQAIDVTNINHEQLLINENDLKIESTASIGETTQTDVSYTKLEQTLTRNQNGPDSSKPPCKKAKQLRIERKLQKLKEKGIDVTSVTKHCQNKEKQVEDFINELPKDVKHKLEIKLVRTNPPSPEFVATAKETHEVYVKYQTVIHNDKLEKCTESKFREFLVHSPLIEEHSEAGPTCGYGSFHQQYWLDGRIIAVGVIDILPKCVSSVYFFYDPTYMNLTLGTYGALREIEFTRYLNKNSPQLQYYYMGYYIHSCKKMRYKGNFTPSDLLCPETYKWFPLSDCIQKLEVSPYSRLDPDIDSIDENLPNENDLNYIPVWYKGVVMLYKIYKRKLNKKNEDYKELMEYARFVGKTSMKSIILFRS
ncbi:unnamed protein product [Diatraea saccharalis]|uniref:Arginyl-tRNA--protein transferase 1 n=1 Tax=Diatraea saccharalis TaxID=40085 RepID=A0A9N9R387_9NEOP|nr:unnamed protein product [Diatraea saccharalis]